MALTAVVFVALLQSSLAGAVSGLTVDTTSGPAAGLINGTTPHVAQFLGIPYAEQPVGERRWLPPILKSREEKVDATRFGHGCPQFEGNASNVWRVDAPEFITPANTTGEDCLSVNIWAPSKPENCSGLLPVIVWIYGGSFQTGSGSIEYQNPSRWVERTRKHIVVGINYRVNIFGFPNAAGLKDDEQNLGLLDQRLGLEWIRSNIANFGGDPERITLWGQSAGAISVDNYNFAYPDDPIHTNFTFVANHFGCGNPNASTELACLRNISSTAIIAFLKAHSDARAVPALSFDPIIDDRTKFANYTARALAGNFSKAPAIIGTTTHEGKPFLRYAAHAPTFRYLYAGNFSNISPQQWQGAYHSADLPLLFGTHGIARGPSTAFEVRVSERMQDYWLAFAEDPVAGLPGLGWGAYEPGGEAVFVGYEGVVSQPIAEGRLEAPCDGLVPREGALPPP